jgi:hypothetical protein
MHRFLVQQVHQYRDEYDKITANRKYSRSRRPPTFRQWLQSVGKVDEYDEAVHQKQVFWWQISGKTDQNDPKKTKKLMIPTILISNEAKVRV